MRDANARRRPVGLIAAHPRCADPCAVRPGLRRGPARRGCARAP